MDNYFEILNAGDEVMVRIEPNLYPSAEKTLIKRAVEAEDGKLWIKATVSAVWNPIFITGIDFQIRKNGKEYPAHPSRLMSIEDWEKKNAKEQE